MSGFKSFLKEHKIRILILASLFVLFWLLFGLRYIPQVSEFWSTTFGRIYQTVIGWTASIFPFSIFELLILGAIAYLNLWIIFFVKSTKKEGIHKSGVEIVNLLLVIFTTLTIYMSTAGMAYHRGNYELPVGNVETIDESKYYEIAKWSVTKMNELSDQLKYDDNGSVINPYSRKEMQQLLDKAFEKIEVDKYTKYTAKPKPFYILGWLYTELNIVGVSFLPTGEANYMPSTPAMDLPFTIAHELSHTKGIMNETDANNVAAYVCLNSGVPYFQYSAYAELYDALDSLAYTVNDIEKYDEFDSLLNKKVIGDYRYRYNFWKKHKFFENVGEFFNNIYLKIFGSETTNDYVDHIDSDIVIIDDEPTYVINKLSPYQKIAIDYWQKENCH